jgi:hypothetical protein
MRKQAVRFLVLLLSCALVGALAHPALGQEELQGRVGGEMTLARAVVGTGVDNMEPVGAAGTFPPPRKESSASSRPQHSQDMELAFVWSLGGKELWKINLPVKAGPKWRTWAHKNVAGQKGDWKVEIKDAEEGFKRVKFKVE